MQHARCEGFQSFGGEEEEEEEEKEEEEEEKEDSRVTGALGVPGSILSHV